MIVRPPFPHERASAGPAVALGIAQAAHSRISGELARLWNGPAALPPEARSELALAAELHDIGFEAQDTEPTWNPRSRLPFSFMDLPADLHLAIWRESVHRVRVLSSYAAYLVSRHTTHLAEQHPPAKSSADKMLVQDFLQDEYREQNEMLSFLQLESSFSTALTPESRRLQQKLVAVWDTLSLAICGALELPLKIALPESSRSLYVEALPGAGRILFLDPWPFACDSVDVHWEGRVFPRLLDNQLDLDRVYPSLPRLFSHAKFVRAA